MSTGKTRFLTPLEAQALEAAAADHLKPLIRFLLCTGARLAEALELEWAHVDLAAGKAMFWKTKGGKPRAAALSTAAITVLANLPHRIGPVFLKDDGKPYVDRERKAGGQIKTGFRGACKRAGLVIRDEEKDCDVPAITPHDLRHTFATWFYSLTKDPFLLRDEGGWATVKMVERYAHLMPSTLVPEIKDVWGPSHPRIGRLPGAASVQAAKQTA